MTPRSKATRLKRLENQKLRLANNPVKYENLEKRIKTLQTTKGK